MKNKWNFGWLLSKHFTEDTGSSSCTLELVKSQSWSTVSGLGIPFEEGYRKKTEGNSEVNDEGEEKG